MTRSPRRPPRATITPGPARTGGPGQPGRREVAAIVADVLTQFALDVGDAAPTGLTGIADRLRAPMRVAVSGRAGVGRSAVAAALAGPRWRVVSWDPGARSDGRHAPDVAVAVTAETVKPEDRAAVAAWRAAGVPVLVVLNKADVAGGDARWLRRCAQAAAAPVVPAIAILAAVYVDEGLALALRRVADGDPLEDRLLRSLGRYGTTHAVRALRDGTPACDLPAGLRALSGIDRVLDMLDAAAAPARYRRLRAATAELQALAARSPLVADLLAGDDWACAVMSAAVDVVQAAGLPVDAGDTPAAHLRRAVRWRHYGRGPVDALHRACATDISRGSLRLLGRCGG